MVSIILMIFGQIHILHYKIDLKYAQCVSLINLYSRLDIPQELDILGGLQVLKREIALMVSGTLRNQQKYISEVFLLYCVKNYVGTL